MVLGDEEGWGVRNKQSKRVLHVPLLNIPSFCVAYYTVLLIRRMQCLYILCSQSFTVQQTASNHCKHTSLEVPQFNQPISLL